MSSEKFVITIDKEWTHFTPKLYYDKYIQVKEVKKKASKISKAWWEMQARIWWKNNNKI